MKLGKRIIKKIFSKSVATASSETDGTSDIPQIVTSEIETERNPTVLEDKMP